MKKNNKGFTLAELLIVVAIIAVLVAIAIPVFSAQLEKSKESTDLANIRSAYATVVASYLEKGAAASATVTGASQADGWSYYSGELKTLVDGVESTISFGTGNTYSVAIDNSGNVTVSAS